MAGLFIVLEGLDGTGKSTQAKNLVQTLLALPEFERYKEKYNLIQLVIGTHQPGGTSFGQALKPALLERKIDSIAELFLFAADRAQHIEEVILPALNQNQIVICERFTASTLAYQGFGRGLNLDMIRNINAYSAKEVKADLTICFDCDPNIALSRFSQRDQIEAEPLEFFDRVRQGYSQIAKSNPSWHTIDASTNQNEVFDVLFPFVRNAILDHIRNALST